MSADEEVTSDRQSSSGPDQQQGALLIHGMTVERYRKIYNSVLTPQVLADLAALKKADYVTAVQDVKHQLWLALNRPHLQETVLEDGRVEVTEVFDLT